MSTKKQLLGKARERYRAAKTRKAKGRVLDDFTENTGYDRKYALKLLNAEKVREVLIIAGGNAATLSPVLMMVEPTGIVSSVNYYDASEKFEIPTYLCGLGMGNINIRGGFSPGGSVRIEKMLSMIRYGRLDPSKLITHTFNGFDKIPEALDLMDKKALDIIICIDI